MSDYTKTITTTAPIAKAYKAITAEMSDWWTPMSAQFLQVGDNAKTDFGGKSYWIFQAKTLTPPTLVELLCVDSNMVADELSDPQEWRGTILRFELSELSEQDSKTVICFTHIGLTPAMECYQLCQSGWNHYILDSFQQYLDGRGGKPNS